MSTETVMNSIVVNKGMRIYSGGTESPKTFKSTTECPWRNQSMSIAYRITQEYNKQDKSSIQREVVTLISKASTKKCTTFVLTYFDKGIHEFINKVYELSGKTDSENQAGTTSEYDKGTAPATKKGKKSKIA